MDGEVRLGNGSNDETRQLSNHIPCTHHTTSLKNHQRLSFFSLQPLSHYAVKCCFSSPLLSAPPMFKMTRGI